MSLFKLLEKNMFLPNTCNFTIQGMLTGTPQFPLKPGMLTFSLDHVGFPVPIEAVVKDDSCRFMAEIGYCLLCEGLGKMKVKGIYSCEVSESW